MPALSLLFVCSELVMFCTLTCGSGRWLLPPPYQLQSLQHWSLTGGIRMLPPFPPLNVVCWSCQGFLDAFHQARLTNPCCGSGCPGQLLGRLGSPCTWCRMAPWPGVPVNSIAGKIHLPSYSVGSGTNFSVQLINQHFCIVFLGPEVKW